MHGNGESAAVWGEEERSATAGRTELKPLTLRFADGDLERAFRTEYSLQNLPNARAAHLIAVLMMVAWGFAIRGFLPPFDRPLDLWLRYGVFIPVLLVGFVLTFVRWYPRVWEWEIAAVLFISMPLWVFYVSRMRTMPPDFGYVGLILMTVFAYTLVRPRFPIVLLVTSVGIAVYVPYAVVAVQVSGVKFALAIFFLISFGGLGAVAGYRMDRSSRLLFLRQRQLHRERQRSDALLLNILPEAIVDRLKRRSADGRLAEALDEVSVLFADAVGFTQQAEKTTPDELVEALDGLFRRFDELADRYGLEKIKTVGDAYMAVAGAPVPMSNHAEAAAEMALAVLRESAEARWPSGDPVVMRIGMATGPAVAGVIGHRKFAYDLWGDTVNLASRLESHGEPGRILVSEELARRLEGRYALGPPRVVDLKGKGPTRVRLLLGRIARVPAPG